MIGKNIGTCVLYIENRIKDSSEPSTTIAITAI